MATQPKTSIPIIDISSPSPSVAQEVLEAASTHGFLFIKNDGVTIPPQDIDAMFELSKSYFRQPAGQKSEYAIHTPKAGGINRGWVRMQGESLDPDLQKQGDPKEAFNIAPPTPSQPLQPLPQPLSSQTPLITRFQTSCHALCTQILSLLAQALAPKDPTYFSVRHDPVLGPSGSIFRMLYYPATAAPGSSQPQAPSAAADARTEKSLRAGAHSDYGSLTLLFRLPGQSGLEVLSSASSESSAASSASPPSSSPSTPQWHPVPVYPDPPTPASPHPPILVNIGDLLSFWTGGLLKSTVHRVVFDSSEGNHGAGEDGGERFSMAYFCHPRDEVRLGAVPSERVSEWERSGSGEAEMRRQWGNVGVVLDGGKGEGGGEAEEMTASEHLRRRLNVTYGLGG